MSKINLGELAPPDAQRDAIHVAVVPMTASRRLSPGEHIAADGGSENPIGVVDPFIRKAVMSGDRFYLCLYPQTVTDMRHHWSHPAFPSIDERVSVPDSYDVCEVCWMGDEEEDTGESRRFLESVANDMGLSYAVMMEDIDDWIAGGEVKVQHGSEQWRDGWDEHKRDFWPHWEAVTGKTRPDMKKLDWDSPYSCTC